MKVKTSIARLLSLWRLRPGRPLLTAFTIIALASLIVGVIVVQAANQTWSGGAGGRNREWYTTLNLVGGPDPVRESDTIQIRGSHTVTVFANVSAAQLTVDSGGTLYTWTGVVSTDWTNPANWSPARTPAPTDILYIGAGTPAPTITNVAGATGGTNETIAQLHIQNSSPTFKTASNGNTLNIDAGSGITGFDVNSLTLTGVGGAALTIKLASGTLGSVSGIFTFVGSNHRLIATAGNAVTFQNNSIFSNKSGFNACPFGDGSDAANGAPGSVIFASGSAYQHNSGNSPFGVAGNASIVTFQTGSSATWLTSEGFQASNRTYANLIIGLPNTPARVGDTFVSGTGNFQFDNLTINSSGGDTSSLTYNGSGSVGTITINGNITSNGAGAGPFAFQPDVVLTAGAGGILISGGTISFSNNGNTRPVNFESNATVSSGTTLTLSRIVRMGLSDSNTRTLTVAGALSGGSTGYVIGSLKKTFAATGTKTFEVGTSNGYSPVDVNAISGTFNADFTISASQGQLPALIGNNALQRYWTLNGSGITANLTFHYSAASPSDIVGNESLYRVFKYSGNSFTQFTPDATGVNSPQDHFATKNNVSSFSDWTLANPSTIPLACAAITISDNGDASDLNAGDGRCDTDAATAGDQCTLRAAIAEANALTTCGTIDINFNLTTPNTINIGAGPSGTALPAIDHNVNLNGPGANLLTVQRSTTAGTPNFRIFTINNSRLVSIFGLTIANGRTRDGSPTTGSAAEPGGGILNAGMLTMMDVIVTGNSSGQGGRVSGRGGKGADGGGLYNVGSLTMTNCTVSGNMAGKGGDGDFGSGNGGDGGGLYNANRLTMIDCVVSGNTAGRSGDSVEAVATGGLGGGIYTGGIVTLTRVNVSNNAAGDGGVGGRGPTTYGNGGHGGGIWTGGVVALNSCIVSGNRAGVIALGTNGFGGGIVAGGSLTMTGSTLTGNAGNLAGAILSGGILRVTNSTITGNTTLGIDPGGAITNFASGGIVSLTNCTITHDTRAGVFNPTDPVTISNTIIAGNWGGAGKGPDALGRFNSLGYNLIGNADGSRDKDFDDRRGFSAVGDQTGHSHGPLNPRLGPLANNGGPTQTQALLVGSPALDSGNNAFVTDPPFTGPTFNDQRGPGFLRIRDASDPDNTQTVDIGAFEADPSVEDISDKSTNEDATLTFTFNLGDAATAFTNITATSNNQALVLDSGLVVGANTASTRTLSITPALNQFGEATITVTVTKGTQSMSDTFRLTVNATNDPPSFTKGPDQTVVEDSGPQSIPGWATAISPGSAVESGQMLNFLVQTNTNPGLFSAGPAISSTGMLSYTPAANANGSAAITIALMDDGGGMDTSPSETFIINVSQVNDPPSFAKGPDQTVARNSGAHSIVNWATSISPGPANESGQTVNFVVQNNSNPALFAAAPAISPSGTLSYQSANNATGSATITVVLQDNSGGTDTSAPQTFVIVVNENHTSIALSSTPNPSNFGQQVTFTATVSAVAPGSGTPTGLVDFLDGATVICNDVALNASGVATCQTSALTVGNHPITVNYLGDSNFNASSGGLTQTVNASDPDLTITKTHLGNFTAGQIGASYTIRVTNSDTGPTSGPVMVTDILPVGLTPTGPVGVVNGWNCSINGAINSQRLTCTRSDVLPGGASYPDISVTVNVANPAPLNVTNTATVTGGSEANTSNNLAADLTNIDCSQDFSLNNTSSLLISRFRENGPGGATDEFVEIFNPATTAHTVASGTCTGGYGVFASAGNGTASNTVSMVCQIPNGTVIPAGGYYLCTGTGYTLESLGRNGGVALATAVGDAPIGCGGSCTGDIPNDAGLALINVGSGGVVNTASGFVASSLPAGAMVVYDTVGFAPYGVGAPAPGYPSLAGNFCEGGACLQPVGDASLLGTCTDPSGLGGLFPVIPAPPACYGQSGQYDLVRRQTTFDATLGTLHQDSNNNANDFILVSPNPGINTGLTITGVAGVTAVLGAAGPYNLSAPPDVPVSNLTRSPFDGADQVGPRNAERSYVQDPNVVNAANNPLGTFALRFKYTNNSGAPVNGVRFQVDNLSTLCGAQTGTPGVGSGEARNLSATPDCGVGSLTSILKLLNSAAEVLVDGSGTAQTVNGTVMEDLSVAGALPPLTPAPGPLSPLGGGVDNTLVVNPSTAMGSVGDGVNGGTANFATAIGDSDPGNVLRIKVKFGVVRSGRFVLLIVPMAKTSPSP